MYYVIEISEGDSKIAGKAIYAYETQLEAMATYHKKMGTAMGSELYTSEMVCVLNYKGFTVAQDYFDRMGQSNVNDDM